MSLIVWCPLINDLHNQGVSSTNLSGGGSIVSSGGKLASSCFHLTTAGTYVTIPELVDKQAFSICCWIKIVTSETYGLWNDCWCVSAVVDGETGPCRIERSNSSETTSLNFVVVKNHESAHYQGISFTTSNGTWVHTVLTYDGTNFKSYANAVLRTTVAKSSFATSFKLNGKVRLGDGNSATYLQDFRIYDNALSETEIKELAKGLVAHYTLGQECAEGAGLTNLYTGHYAQGYCAYANTMTRTKVDNYTNYVLSYTGTGNNSLPRLLWSPATETPTIGAKYVWSCKVRVNSCSDGARSAGLVMRNSLRDNDYTDGGASISLAVANLGKWITYNRTITIPEKCSQGNVDPKPRLEFYWGNCNGNGTNYSCNFDVMESAIYKSDYVCTLVSPSKFSPYIYDSSGYCRNGTVNGALNLCDSIRYNKAIEGNGNIIINGMTINNPFTISMWIYFPVTGTIGDNGREIRIGPVTIYKATTTVDNHAIVFTKSDSSLLYVGLTDPALNKWYHIVITSDGSNVKIYKNGIYSNREASLKNGMSVCSLMEYNLIKLSDVRIYATALSEDDVKDLYNLGASIS